jgi:branched-chain amino acid transport system substrate-binding protein
MKLLSTAAQAALLLGVIGTGAASAQSAEPIKIGEINSYTGPIAAFTKVYRQGFDLAVDEINAKGGVLGRKLEVVYRDDNFSPADASRMANELVLNEKVDLLAGAFLSPIGLAIASYADKNHVLYVATEPLADNFTWGKTSSRYVYRVEEPISVTTKGFAKQAMTMKCTKWAGIGPISSAVTDMFNDFKADMANQPGFVWAGESMAPLGKVNPGATIDYLQRSGADCILSSHVGGDLVGVIREGKARGWYDKIQAINLQLGIPEWLNTLGENAPAGWYASGYPWDSIDIPAHKQFVADYQAKYGTPPGYGSVVGYLSVQAIAAGIAKTGSTDTEKMVEGFKGAEFDSIVGHSKWRADHQVDFGHWIGRIAMVDGKPKLVDTIYDITYPTEAEGLAMRSPEANK